MHETSEAGVRVDAAGEPSSEESIPSWTRKMNNVHFLHPLRRRRSRSPGHKQVSAIERGDSPRVETMRSALSSRFGLNTEMHHTRDIVSFHPR